jgi:prevent-host-death family protein
VKEAHLNVVDVFDARNRLDALIDEVERGGEFVITRRGKPVARLVAAEKRFHQAQATRTAQRLRTASKGKALGLSVKSLIENGHR